MGIFISVNTYQALGNEQSPVQMLTYLHVRDDALQLYGFSEESERQMFRQLIGIGGIGPRLALTILSGLTVQELAQAIITGDVQLLTGIPGVGKKTAQRIVLELKDKIEEVGEVQKVEEFAAASPQVQDKWNEAIQALLSLGYRQADARKSVNKVSRNHPDNLPVEDIIKLALKEV